MQYVIHYEVAIAVMLVVLLGFSLSQYNAENERTKGYILMVGAVLIGIVFDVSSAYTISVYQRIPVSMNLLLNSVHMFWGAMCAYLMAAYIVSYTGVFQKRSMLVKMNRIVLLCYLVTIIINFFMGFIFSFGADGYTKGFLYGFAYLVPLYYVVSCGVVIVLNRPCFTQKQIASSCLLMIMFVAATIIQSMFLQEYLLTYFAAGLAVQIFFFTLETPEYQKLEEALVDLEKARREAEEASKTKSTFLANMSHEIRTPLNGIMGMNEILTQEVNDPTAVDCSKNIYSSCKALLSIINDILDISKIESGKMELHEGEYSVKKVFADAYNMLAQKADDKSLELSVNFDGSIPDKLWGDEVRVRQIIVNILGNAVKYTKEGSVQLNAFWEPCEQTKNGREMINLVVYIKDTGVGIQKENLDRMFDAFQRVDLQKNRSIEGTGLGLGIAKQLTDMMGGQIIADSIYGQGSTFTIIIPQGMICADAPEMSAEAMVDLVKEQEEPVLRGHILSVDDVEMNLKVVKGLLRSTELEIDEARNGMEALEKTQQTKYDLILMDYMMPEMDGRETLEKIRSTEGNLNSETPIIVLTANALTGMREQYLKEGFTDYLSKPVRKQVLEQMLEKYLDKN